MRIPAALSAAAAASGVQLYVSKTWHIERTAAAADVVASADVDVAIRGDLPHSYMTVSSWRRYADR